MIRESLTTSGSDIEYKYFITSAPQGFVLGQYALLWAARHPDKVSRLLLLNTPISLGAKLRPELAAYKTPIAFLRPGNKPFDGTTYAAQVGWGGSVHRGSARNCKLEQKQR